MTLDDPTVQSYEVLVAWIRRLKGISTIQQRAESAIHRQEVEMWEGETFQELFRKIWKLGEDAWGPEQGWDHNQRRLLAECFEHATRDHKDRHHLPLHELRTRTQQWICSRLEILDDQKTAKLLHPSLQGGKKAEKGSIRRRAPQGPRPPVAQPRL